MSYGQVTTVEQNKAITRQFFHAYERQDVAAIERLVNPDSVYHFPRGPERDQVFAKRAERFFAAFTDIRITVEDQVAAEDKVVSRARFRVTHRGEFRGIPSTGKQITSTFIQIDRIVDGRIVEQWFQYDLATMLDQMGAVTTLTEPKRS